MKKADATFIWTKIHAKMCGLSSFSLSRAGIGIGGSIGSCFTAHFQECVDKPGGDSFRDAADNGAHEVLRARLAKRVGQHGQLFLRFFYVRLGAGRGVFVVR